jgi:hypothetical protein
MRLIACTDGNFNYGMVVRKRVKRRAKEERGNRILATGHSGQGRGL